MNKANADLRSALCHGLFALAGSQLVWVLDPAGRFTIKIDVEIRPIREGHPVADRDAERSVPYWGVLDDQRDAIWAQFGTLLQDRSPAIRETMETDQAVAVSVQRLRNARHDLVHTKGGMVKTAVPFRANQVKPGQVLGIYAAPGIDTRKIIFEELVVLFGEDVPGDRVGATVPELLDRTTT